MKAILLAAGEGSRCYPFTYLSPKIFQQVGGIPLLEYMLSWFGGTPEIKKLYIVARNDSMVERLKNYVQKRGPYLNEIVGLFKRLGYQVEYANRDLKIDVIRANSWGTGGDLRLALEHVTSSDELGTDFLVCYADYVISRRLLNGKLSPQLNLSEIINYHRNCKKVLDTVMTLALTIVEREEATRFGVGQIEKVKGFNIVCGFIEKPGLHDVPDKPSINAGVYVIDSDFILSSINEFLPSKPDISFERNVVEPLVKDVKPKLAAYLLDLYAWFDVGTLKQLIDANVFITSKKEL